MGVYLRLSAERAAGERLLHARPFGRRSMCEAGLRAERGRGPRIGINVQVSDREYEDFRGQVGAKNLTALAGEIGLALELSVYP